jgi:hypothetical protein
MGKLTDKPFSGVSEVEKLIGITYDDLVVNITLQGLVEYIKNSLVTISDTPPSNPGIGDIWVDTN